MNAAVSGAVARRELSQRDLVLFYIVAVFNLRWLPVAAAAGPSAIVVWIIACITLFVPLAICVVELSRRYPEEGGLYVWSQRAFGNFAGFMTGWTFWTSNLPYFPGVLYFAAGNALFITGAEATGLAESPAYFIIASLIGLTIAVLPNILGLRIGKWVQNIGAIGVWIPALFVITLGAIAYAQFGSATEFTWSSLIPGLGLKDILFWSTIAFAFGGVETASLMARDIQNPTRTIPRAILISGVIVTALYLVGTIAILVLIPQREISGIQGVMQAINRTTELVGLGGMTPLVALLVTVGSIGAVGAWLTAIARLPFVAGVDRHLPAAFAKVHPRYGTPHVAMIAQALVTAALIIVGQAGTNVRGAYNVMISMSIIAYFIPFLFMFAAMIRLRSVETGHTGVLSRGRGGTLVASVGFISTLIALVLAFIPAADEPNKPLAIAKVVGLTTVLLGAGVAVYLRGARRR